MVFSDAIRQGLVVSRAEHPGFYYMLSAQHICKTKQLCSGVGAHEVTGKDEVFIGRKEFDAAGVDPADALAVLERETSTSQQIVEVAMKAKGFFQRYNVLRIKKKVLPQVRASSELNNCWLHACFNWK